MGLRPPVRTPTQVQPMCPGRESNPKPLSVGDDVPTDRATRAGAQLYLQLYLSCPQPCGQWDLVPTLAAFFGIDFSLR